MQTDSPVAAPPDVSVVIVCCNNRRDLEQCLASVVGAGLRHPFDIAVVDNGSTDGTPRMLRERYPQVLLVENGGNVGLSRASNQGIERTRGRYVLLLNDDTVVNASSLDAMVDFMETHPRAGAVGGRLVNPDGSFQSGFNRFPSLGQEFLIATRLSVLVSAAYPAHGDAARATEVDWVNSACLLVRRATLDAVGVLRESYFIYGDEVDLQYRMKRAGWNVYYLPEVTTIHLGGRSLDRWRRRRMVYRGKMLFYRDNYGALRTGALRVMLAMLSVVKLAVWGVMFLNPRRRERARRELSSNVDVLRLCWALA